MNAVEIGGLTYTYPGVPQPTLRDISLQIPKGDFLAVVGNNGCGKSTLCKALNGLIPHFITGTMEGSVRVCGLNTLEYDVGVLAQKVGYVYQDFENQIVRPTVLDDASYSCLNYAFPDYLERGRTALKQCGLEGREAEYVWQLSGGQTHLLALAGAVSLQPDILILDEPIAQLDPMHADRIYGVLRELNERWGKTIIVIEHHTEYIADYCKHVMLMKDGQVRWMLPTEEALQRVEELEECNIFPPQVTQAAYRLQRQGRLPADLPLPTTVEAGKTAFSRLRYVPGAPHRAPEASGETAVSFQGVSLSYRAVKGEPHTVFDGSGPEHPQGGEGGPHRLQRGGQVHPDEADGGAAEAQCRHSLPLWRGHWGQKGRGSVPADLPGVSKPGGDVHQGLHPRRHRLRHGGAERPGVGEAHRGAAGAVPADRAGRTGTAASCPAGRCAGPAWPSASP